MTSRSVYSCTVAPLDFPNRSRRITSCAPSPFQPPAADNGLAGDVVGFRGTEEVDRVGRLPGRAGAPQGNELVLHRLEEAGLDPHGNLPALHMDPGFPSRQRLGQAGLDQPEGHAIDVDL